jgi:AsmA protein
MSRSARIILAVAGILVLLLVIATFFFPVDRFRPTIEAKASAALGRPVTLGRLTLSLFTGSLSAETLAVGDDPAFSKTPFLTAKSVKVGVEMRPLLLSRTLSVTGITIEQPELTLIRDAAGRWNYASLGASHGGTADNSDRPPGGAAPPFSIEKLELKQGRLIVGSTASNKRSTYDRVEVTASNVSLTSASPVTASASLPGGGALSVDGTVGPLNQADASLTPLDATITVDKLDLAATGFLDPSAHLGGLLDLKATISARNQAADLSGNATLSNALLVAGGSPATKPVVVSFKTRYDRQRHAGVLNPSTVSLAGATARLNGSYDAAGDDTGINVAIAGDRMPVADLAAFLPALGIQLPAGASLTTGTLTTRLNVVGATSKFVTTGNVALANARLSGFDLPARVQTISALTGLRLPKDLDIDSLTTNIGIAPQGVRFDHFNAVVRSLGELTGAGTIDAKNNLDFKMVATLPAGATGAVGAASGALDAVLGILASRGDSSAQPKGQSRGQRVPFVVKGTTSHPEFVPDVNGLVLQTLRQQVGQLPTVSAPRKPDSQNPNPLGLLDDLLKSGKR